MAEEYDVRSNEIIVRKWRKKSSLGVEKWEYEIGEELMPRNVESEGLVESSSNPIFVRRDTKDAYQWRVRNLPYPSDTYLVSVDQNQIVIKTTNKKYYKKFSIPDMDRAKCPLSQQNLSHGYANNTLIVTYKKPSEILAMEKSVQEELLKIKASKDGDVECNPS
ncbi:protein DPCD-like isoform X2 [Liolophura sinensis]